MKTRYLVRNIAAKSYLYPDWQFRYDPVEAARFGTREDAEKAVTTVLSGQRQRTEQEKFWNSGLVLVVLEVFLPEEA